MSKRIVTTVVAASIASAVLAGASREAGATAVDAKVPVPTEAVQVEDFVPTLFDRLERVIRFHLEEDERVRVGPVFTPANFAMALPVLGRHSARFGRRRDPITRRRRMHKGIDVAARRGTPVVAAAPGVVVKVRRSGGYGRVVEVDHGNGLTTRYAHLHRFRVKRGQRVDTATVIGLVGSSGRSTGPHLHFEVRQDGRALDPMLFFRAPSRLLLAALRLS